MRIKRNIHFQLIGGSRFFSLCLRIDTVDHLKNEDEACSRVQSSHFAWSVWGLFLIRISVLWKKYFFLLSL